MNDPDDPNFHSLLDTDRKPNNTTTMMTTMSSMSSSSEHDDYSSYVSCKNFTSNDAPKLAILFLKQTTRLFEVIPDLEVKTSSWSPDMAERLHILIKGAVQSGKTAILTALALYLTMVHKQSVIVLVRNITEDSSQFHDAWTAFLSKFEEFCADRDVMFDIGDFDSLPPLYYAGAIPSNKKVTEDDGSNNDDDHDDNTSAQNGELDICDAMLQGPTIILALTNPSQVEKINDVLKTLREDAEVGVSLLVDEVDQLLYGEGKKCAPALDKLLSSMDHVLGVTATAWKPIHDIEKRFFSTNNVYFMTPSSNYRGIMDQEYVTLQELPKDVVKGSSALVSDPDLLKFLIAHREDAPVMINRRDKSGLLCKEKHPFLALVNTERLIHRQDTLLEDIGKHPELCKKYTIMTYNGNCITLYAPNLKKKEDLRLPVCNKKPKRQGNRLIYRGASLRHVLQWMKSQPDWRIRFPRILIIAQNMVGRGLNIVSYDYEWHLSDFYWRPSKEALIESRMQDQRVCGIFTDDLACRVHCTLEDERDLKIAHQLQEEIFQQRLSSRRSELEASSVAVAEALKELTFYKEKVPSGKINRKGVVRFAGKIVDTPDDGGWSMEEFSQGRLPEEPTGNDDDDKPSKKKAQTHTELSVEDDEKRLREKMFPKWSKDSNADKIASFMKDLDPHKVYSLDELKAYCVDKDYDGEYSRMVRVKGNNSFGRILVGDTAQGYRLNPNLVQAYLEFF